MGRLAREPALLRGEVLGVAQLPLELVLAVQKVEEHRAPRAERGPQSHIPSDRVARRRVALERVDAFERDAHVRLRARRLGSLAVDLREQLVHQVVARATQSVARTNVGSVAQHALERWEVRVADHLVHARRCWDSTPSIAMFCALAKWSRST